jgi:hypothetical protein
MKILLNSILFVYLLHAHQQMQKTYFILFSKVTSHYVIDQSVISICDMKKMVGGEAKDPQYSSYTSMLINYLIFINRC